MELLSRARALRKNQTDAESRLWRLLRNRQVAGAKFRRQVPIDKYIVDFVCMENKLIIELDGGQHAEAKEYDEQRTRELEKRGFQVIRFWNHEVLENMEGVFDSLTLALSRRERGRNE